MAQHKIFMVKMTVAIKNIYSLLVFVSDIVFMKYNFIKYRQIAVEIIYEYALLIFVVPRTFLTKVRLNIINYIL